MLFDINITSSKNSFAKKANSLLVKFFIDEKTLKIDYSEIFTVLSNYRPRKVKIAMSCNLLIMR